MSASTGSTQVGTTVHVSQVSDLANVIAQCGKDMSHIIGVSGVTFQHDLGKIKEEVGLMALYDLISSVSLVFYVGDTLVRSYDYHISGHSLTFQGPAAGETPVAASFPPGTVATVRVATKPGATEDPIYKRFGWTPTKPFKGRQESTKIGTFVSGNYGWERVITTNPDLDRGNRS